MAGNTIGWSAVGRPAGHGPSSGQSRDGQPRDGQPRDGQRCDGQSCDGRPSSGQSRGGQPSGGQPSGGCGAVSGARLVVPSAPAVARAPPFPAPAPVSCATSGYPRVSGPAAGKPGTGGNGAANIRGGKGVPAAVVPSSGTPSPVGGTGGSLGRSAPLAASGSFPPRWTAGVSGMPNSPPGRQPIHPVQRNSYQVNALSDYKSICDYKE